MTTKASTFRAYPDSVRRMKRIQARFKFLYGFELSQPEVLDLALEDYETGLKRRNKP